MSRSCISCGRIVEHGSYCKQHNPANQYRTPAHRAAQAQARSMTGTLCPECNHIMDATNPPQAAHVVAITLGGQSTPSNYHPALCRACNSTQRGQAG